MPRDRRHFLKTASAVAATSFAVPTLLLARRSDETIVGEGDFRYRVDHDYFRLPDRFHWQTTHNVAVDSDRNVYVIHEGRRELKEHPSIFVFDDRGQFIRAFGAEFQGGGHGLEVRREGSEEFLYVTAYQSLKKFAKLTLTGETVWTRRAPMDSGLYAAGEDVTNEGAWGRDRFMPTNIAFLDDGGFLVADGYGSYAVHRYDADANYLSTFGVSDSGERQFNLPHGVWIDRRDPEVGEKVVIADRVNNRLCWYTPGGERLADQEGFLLPANVDARDSLLLVPELQARITVLDGDNQVVARLGDDGPWREKVLADNFRLRREPDQWRAGRFLHPHDACFDAAGNILVAEWVATGRVSRLTRVDT